jgi:hypothetical protein
VIAMLLATCASGLGAASAQAEPPVNTSPPTISGNAVEGETLTGDVGTWEGNSLNFTRQWQRSNGAGWEDIASATDDTYVLTSGDGGHTIRLRVTATDNQDEATTAVSEPTSTVAPLPPVNTSPPTISGIAVEGQTLTGSNGTWEGDPVSFAHQWERSDGLGGYEDIAGATDSTYTLTSADLGQTIRLAVIASNGGGDSEPAFSDPVGPAAARARPPENIAAPTISGNTIAGQTLTGTNGTWQGHPDSFAYQWQRSDGGPYENIDGATNPTYTLRSADVGRTVRLRVIASNEDGPSDPAPSNELGPVTAAPGSPQRALELFVSPRPTAFKRATIRASGVAAPPSRLWVYENVRGKTCPTVPAERNGRTRTVIDGVEVGGTFTEKRRPRMKKPGRHAYCAYLGPSEDTAYMASFTTRKVRKPLLTAGRARRTVATALRRHGFADRVVANLEETCSRRSRSEFQCRFASAFPGYFLRGLGSVELRKRLSYRFQVSIRGRSFELTDENEGGLPG